MAEDDGDIKWTIEQMRRYLALRANLSEEEVSKLSWEELEDAIKALPPIPVQRDFYYSEKTDLDH